MEKKIILVFCRKTLNRLKVDSTYNYDVIQFNKKNYKLINQKILKKCNSFKKNIKQFFIEQQISILKGFLKDGVTLKTGIITSEKSQLCHHRNKLHIQI